jgi:hypothetical protein
MAFHIDIFAWPAASQLLAFPALLQLFSRGAYLIPWSAPLRINAGSSGSSDGGRNNPTRRYSRSFSTGVENR